MTLTRSLRFEPGYDCRRFECCLGRPDCQPGSDGYHGIGGLSLRFLVRGDKGAVQFLLFTHWLPEPEQFQQYNRPLPVDLGYHALSPQWDGQKSMGSCESLDGADCYYDGSALNAEEPFRILCNEGDESLWRFLEQYYRATFEDGEQPTGAPYPFMRRQDA